MTDREGFERFLRRKLRQVGQQYERARSEFHEGHAERTSGVPTDDQGRARIVCRRHAERRAVRLDGSGRPTCFEAGHTDCEGCVEDIDNERIETW